MHFKDVQSPLLCRGLESSFTTVRKATPARPGTFSSWEGQRVEGFEKSEHQDVRMFLEDLFHRWAVSSGT